MINRRTFNSFALLAAAPLLARAQADAFPHKQPIWLVSAFSPGTSTDAIARFVGDQLARSLNAQVVVDNRVGAGGMIAGDYVAKAPPDGYTLLFTNASHYSLPWTTPKLPYDTQKDFAPVAVLAQAALVWTVPADSPYRTLQDVLEAARKNPGKLTYSTAGAGTTTNMAGALLNSMAGVNIRHVPYKVASQAIVDVSTGAVSMGVSGLSGAAPLIQGGRLRAIAITSPARSDLLPELPTVDESGVRGYQVVTPVFTLARAGTPPAVLTMLSNAIVNAGRTPEFKKLCAAQMVDVTVQDEKALAAAMPQEFAKWKVLAELAAQQG